MSLPQQTDFITKKLLEAGVQPSISNTAFTSNTSYELGDYVLIDINLYDSLKEGLHVF